MEEPTVQSRLRRTDFIGKLFMAYLFTLRVFAKYLLKRTEVILFSYFVLLEMFDLELELWPHIPTRLLNEIKHDFSKSSQKSV